LEKGCREVEELGVATPAFIIMALEQNITKIDRCLLHKIKRFKNYFNLNEIATRPNINNCTVHRYSRSAYVGSVVQSRRQFFKLDPRGDQG
jgi:hypothetical protein